MKGKTVRDALGAAVALPLAVGGTLAAQGMPEHDAAAAQPTAIVAEADGQASEGASRVTQAKVEGTFSYSQEQTASVSEILAAFSKAPQYLCDKAQSGGAATTQGSAWESSDAMSWARGSPPMLARFVGEPRATSESMCAASFA